MVKLLHVLMLYFELNMCYITTGLLFIEKNMKYYFKSKFLAMFVFTLNSSNLSLTSLEVYEDQGLVVRIIVSLTSLLRGQLVKCFTPL